jgi:hypothetical protein
MTPKRFAAAEAECQQPAGHAADFGVPCRVVKTPLAVDDRQRVGAALDYGEKGATQVKHGSGNKLVGLLRGCRGEGRHASANGSIPLGKSDGCAVGVQHGGSSGLGRDRAVIGLGDKESAFVLRLGNGLPPSLGFSRGQSREDLLLVALDTL